MVLGGTAMIPNYEYVETDSEQELPSGENWEFWGKRITPDEEKAVWRRIVEE